MPRPRMQCSTSVGRHLPGGVCLSVSVCMAPPPPQPITQPFFSNCSSILYMSSRRRPPPPPAPNVTARGMIVLMCLRRMLECPCFGCGAFPGVALCTQVQTVDVAADSVDEASLAFTGWTPSPEVSAFLRDAGRTMLSELSRSATSRAFDGEGTPGLAVTAVCGSGCNSRSLVNHALALVLHCVGSGAA
jgi:hypothetical protein